MTSWITLYPQWFISERNAIARSYPDFRVDEKALQAGVLLYYGELIVRPSKGSQRHAVRIHFPEGSPFELPIVTPVASLPEFDEEEGAKEHPEPVFFNRRHQMANGSLCLFQRETRGTEGGEWVSATDVLQRTEEWLLGRHTGRWPPDSRESELESHFYYAGDVLLSKTFYSEDVSGFGSFHMVRDIRRILDAVSKEDPPLIVTVITNNTEGVESVYDAREDLENIYPWLGNDAWSPEKLSELEEHKEDDYRKLVAEHGHWWSLPEEPLPFHTGADLLKELQKVAPDDDAWKMVSAAIGTELSVRSTHFFGLRYPGRTGGFEWLVLNVVGKSKETKGGAILLSPNKGDKRRDFENGKVTCYRVHGARPTEIQLRNTSVVRDDVRDKTAALIGLGALGSKAAELLAQAGVGTFRLCDMDRLNTGNVARHVGGLSDFGAEKTRVVMTRLFDINPHLKISATWNESAVSSLNDLARFIAPADITICTTADENVESAINQIAVMTNKPVVYGRAMRSGSMGRVFLVRPGQDPCKMCLGLFARESRDGVGLSEDWIEVTERDEDVLLHECGRPVIPASAVDLSFVASLIARVALDVLEQREPKQNHWLWSREVATDLDSRFDKPLVTVCNSLPRHNDCPVCQEPDIVGAVLSEAVRAEILSHVHLSVSVESGGILLGFVDDERKAVVVRATGPGPKAKKSAARFERDVDFVQAELEQAARDFGRRGLYIGEWHSHLNAEPEPSGRDIMSMCGIAEASNYATRCPIMLIAGIDIDTAEVVTLRTWSFPVSGRVYSIEHEVVPNAGLDARKPV
ncbi:MAG: ThiF family adenylyltransferase [Candidatus Nealsonbacteria bacterium]|nr:ThiF family adenylyltransferase [Candidatus Nealsonbacteria bacterium]